MFSEFCLRNLCLPFGSFLKNYSFIYLFVLFQHGLVVCRILVPWSRIKPKHLEVEAWSLNHYTAKEVPLNFVVLNSTLRSKIHEILWCEVGDWAHFFTIQIPCDFSTICWKRFPSSLELLYCFCQKLINHIHTYLCTVSKAALVHVPILMLITNCYQAVLMTVALY